MASLHHLQDLVGHFEGHDLKNRRKSLPQKQCQRRQQTEKKSPCPSWEVRCNEKEISVYETVTSHKYPSPLDHSKRDAPDSILYPGNWGATRERQQR